MPRLDRKPTVAVLGLGSIGLRHARNLLNRGHAVRGYDPDPTRRHELQALGGSALAEREAAFAGADAVVIASPSANHLADLKDAVARGKHVLAEKPIAHTDEGLDDVLETAKRKRLIVYNGYMLRHHPGVRRAVEIVRRGDLGRLIWARFLCASWLPGWRPKQDYRQGYAARPEGGGALLDHIHEFDLAHVLLGPAVPVAASAARSGVLDMPTEDLADVVLRHANGVRSHIHADYVTRPPMRCFDLIGEGGRLFVDLNARRLARSDTGGAISESSDFGGSYDDDYVEEIADFATRVAEGLDTSADGDAALEVLRVVLRAKAIAGF
jgi:predicted dehydrogenase